MKEIFLFFVVLVFQCFASYREDIARCELRALRLGGEISDVFNAPIGDEDWNERMSQDFILERLGFAPWSAGGIYKSGGMTLTQNNAKEMQVKGGWVDRKVEDSPYSVLNHKWIYMFGDSTTRQVWASFAAPFQGNNFERNAKEYARQYCNKQEHRVRHVHSPDAIYPPDNWAGPCGANEVTCHVSGYGDEGILSLDWKHFPYEDYDEYIWGEQGPWQIGFPGAEGRRPDILTLQMGLHSCWHADPHGLYSKHLHAVNETMINTHLQDIRKLMAAVRKAVELAAKDGHPTKTVIVLTSGATGMPNSATINECILRMNRAVDSAAHEQGFAVLDRGEIERRLMHKSLFSDHPSMAVEMHLHQPAQNIIATCLLDMITCLDGIDMSKPYEYVPRQNHKIPPANTLHVPPPA